MTSIGGRLIGLDHGLARIGVAVSDPSGLLARELTIIHRASKREDFAQLQRLVEEHGAIAFVVGVPDEADAMPGAFTQADKVRNWIGYLRETLPLPVVEWNETLSSHDAREIARQKRRPPRDPIDDLAARVILQSYLDAVRDGLADPPVLFINPNAANIAPPETPILSED